MKILSRDLWWPCTRSDALEESSFLQESTGSDHLIAYQPYGPLCFFLFSFLFFLVSFPFLVGKTAVFHLDNSI